MLVKFVFPDSELSYDINPFFHFRSRQSALASLKSGNKKTALKHARELKITTESRKKVASLLNRVEEVLNAIADAESTKTVTYCYGPSPPLEDIVLFELSILGFLSKFLKRVC